MSERTAVSFALPGGAVPDPRHRTRVRGKSLYISAQDGLRLHVREYGTRAAPGLPVVCLPGLARTPPILTSSRRRLQSVRPSGT